LLVVSAIMAICRAACCPAVQKVREAAAEHELRQPPQAVGLAMTNYHGRGGQIPLGAKQTNPRQTWVMYLWPFIEQEKPVRQINLSHPAVLPPARHQRPARYRPAGAKVAIDYLPSKRGRPRLPEPTTSEPQGKN